MQRSAVAAAWLTKWPHAVQQFIYNNIHLIIIYVYIYTYMHTYTYIHISIYCIDLLTLPYTLYRFMLYRKGGHQSTYNQSYIYIYIYINMYIYSYCIYLGLQKDKGSQYRPGAELINGGWEEKEEKLPPIAASFFGGGGGLGLDQSTSVVFCHFVSGFGQSPELAAEWIPFIHRSNNSVSQPMERIFSVFLLSRDRQGSKRWILRVGGRKKKGSIRDDTMGVDADMERVNIIYATICETFAKNGRSAIIHG